jgi:hypothetical protein
MLLDSFYLTPEQMARPQEEVREALVAAMWTEPFKNLNEYDLLLALALESKAPQWVLSFAYSALFYVKLAEDIILNGTGEPENLGILTCTSVQCKKEGK